MAYPNEVVSLEEQWGDHLGTHPKQTNAKQQTKQTTTTATATAARALGGAKTKEAGEGLCVCLIVWFGKGQDVRACAF